MILSKQFSIVALLLAITISSCSKTSKSTTPTPTPSVGGFTWSENGGTEITADSAFFESSYNTIKAYKTGKFFEINLTSGVPATYTLGTTNAFAMLAGKNLYTASSGSLIITANASSKMTGTFTTTGSGASVTKLDGKFTDIAVR